MAKRLFSDKRWQDSSLEDVGFDNYESNARAKNRKNYP